MSLCFDEDEKRVRYQRAGVQGSVFFNAGEVETLSMNSNVFFSSD